MLLYRRALKENITNWLPYKVSLDSNIFLGLSWVRGTFWGAAWPPRGYPLTWGLLGRGWQLRLQEELHGSGPPELSYKGRELPYREFLHKKNFLSTVWTLFCSGMCVGVCFVLVFLCRSNEQMQFLRITAQVHGIIRLVSKRDGLRWLGQDTH